MSGYVEVGADGERTQQVFERDAHGRISKITAIKAGATAPGKPIHPRGGFVNRAPDDVERQMAALHKAAWVAFVERHGVEKIAKSYRDRAR